MSKKQFSMAYYFNEIAKQHIPQMTFTGSTPQDFFDWKAEALPKLKELLGEFPAKVPLEAEVEYSVVDGDIIRERVVFDSEEFMSVPCHLLYPKDMKKDGSNAAIVCSHGHGPYGKDPVAGVIGEPQYKDEIYKMNYDYGLQMAKAGFLTIIPDMRGFGDRRGGAQPFPGRDTCNVNFIKGALLGIYSLTMNIWDVKCCIDYLETRPEVDKNRIGMMGLSFGGTMTTFTTAVEERIKAADIICYVNPFKAFAIRDANFCGSQFVPEIYKYFDTSDIAGMIAPRPLLMEMGIFDKCFPLQDTIQGYEAVKKIYTAAGVEEKLYTDIFPWGHSFGGNAAFDFFKKYL